MEPFIILAIFSVAMFIGSYLAGSIPLMFSLSVRYKVANDIKFIHWYNHCTVILVYCSDIIIYSVIQVTVNHCTRGWSLGWHCIDSDHP